MLTPEVLRDLVKAASAPNRGPDDQRAAMEEAVRGLDGGPADVVATAVAGLDSDDRNMRLAMVVFSLYPDEAATAAVVRHLRDPKRRVPRDGDEVAPTVPCGIAPHHRGTAHCGRRIRDQTPPPPYRLLRAVVGCGPETLPEVGRAKR